MTKNDRHWLTQNLHLLMVSSTVIYGSNLISKYLNVSESGSYLKISCQIKWSLKLCKFWTIFLFKICWLLKLRMIITWSQMTTLKFNWWLVILLNIYLRFLGTFAFGFKLIFHCHGLLIRDWALSYRNIKERRFSGSIERGPEIVICFDVHGEKSTQIISLRIDSTTHT